MESFDFTKAKVLRESGDTLPIDSDTVNSILRLDLDIRELEQRLQFATSPSEVNFTRKQIKMLDAERTALESHLDEHGRADLSRLRTVSGGV